MDIRDPPRQQVEGFHAIEAEVQWINPIEWPYPMLTTVRQLRATFPDFFDGEDSETRVDLAKQMLSAYHGRRRFKSNQDRRAVQRRKKKSPVASVCKANSLSCWPTIDADAFLHRQADHPSMSEW